MVRSKHQASIDRQFVGWNVLGQGYDKFGLAGLDRGRDSLSGDGAIGWIGFGDDQRTGVGFGLGFGVTVEKSDKNPHARQDEYGWGGAASTHYWLSPHDRLIVVTMEQRWPYSPETEEALKPVIYGAIGE